MLRLSGEMTNFLEILDVNTKTDLLVILRLIRKNLKVTENTDYDYFYNMIGVAIQQAYYTNAEQLEKYLNYTRKKDN